ncbi:membrane dipeptidase [Veillonella sp.]|uniref:dipeptidase n=1 Tax=Veillonella sp. TaxID=1926307 RepID=UPI00290A0C8B|nr:membrane dipeptidase [Veillonella sp.]MDU3564001.1 membrane dipeptidase [Veillonella sp.]MDU3630954.1 membrane dipeptidase [Veillonella sp.]MDU3639974.1 membrane dipeptidase [Veillonella sp.]
MIDLHCDTIMQLLDHPDSGDLYRNTWKIDIEKLQKAHSKVQDFALFINLGKTNDPYGRYEEMRNLCTTQIHLYGEHIQHVLSYQDVESVYESGKIGALMSIEEGGVLGGDLDKLKQAYQDGVRLITLTWNYPNGLGEPHCGEQHKKLTPKGIEFVEAMQDLGIIVDCSHLNDAGTEQLGDILDAPFVASHSNAREVTAHTRNLPDNLIKLIANKGGVIGLNFAQSFLGTSPVSLIEDIVKHGLYLINKGGEDVVALGTDFDGIKPNTEIKDASEMYRLYDAFKEAGLSVEQCEKLFWKNADRLLKEIL